METQVWNKGHLQIGLVRGDITKQRVDAIVNAANTSLLGGGGVDGAIHRAGGKAILEACQQIRSAQGGCAVGEAVVTTAGNLPCRAVIHTVGPVWSGEERNETGLLGSCYRQSLLLAEQRQLTSIAFPNISTGIYRFPKPLAAQIAVQSVLEAAEPLQHVRRVTFVCFDEDNYRLYEERLRSMQPG